MSASPRGRASGRGPDYWNGARCDCTTAPGKLPGKLRLFPQYHFALASFRY